MGLLVNSGILPGGIQVNNVYMTFSDFPVYIMPKGKGQYDIRGFYSVYPSETAPRTVRDTSTELVARVTDVSVCLHTMLYAQLKSLYPDSTNIL
jgi:hypothetical protein